MPWACEPGTARWLLIRRARRDPDARAYSLVFAPADASLAELAGAAGLRSTIEACFQHTKDDLGLDHCEARSWHGWHRHMIPAARSADSMVVFRTERGCFTRWTRGGGSEWLWTSSGRNFRQRSCAERHRARRTRRHRAGCWRWRLCGGATPDGSVHSRGMDRQTLRDWICHYSAEELAGHSERPLPGRAPMLDAAPAHGVDERRCACRECGAERDHQVKAADAAHGVSHDASTSKWNRARTAAKILPLWRARASRLAANVDGNFGGCSLERPGLHDPDSSIPSHADTPTARTRDWPRSTAGVWLDLKLCRDHRRSSTKGVAQ